MLSRECRLSTIVRGMDANGTWTCAACGSILTVTWDDDAEADDCLPAFAGTRGDGIEVEVCDSCAGSLNSDELIERYL